MSAIYALNLFDLAPNDDYKAYSKRSVAAVGKHGGSVVVIGRLSKSSPGVGDSPCQVLVLVEWPSAEAFRAFNDDPDHLDLRPLREGGTENYLWWAYGRLEDLRPALNNKECTPNGSTDRGHPTRTTSTPQRSLCPTSASWPPPSTSRRAVEPRG